MPPNTTRQRVLAEVDWSLYVILDPRALQGGADLFEVGAAALRGGAGVLQLRDKSSSAREVVARARRLGELCRAHGALCIVNDRLDIALAAGADGAHLGPEDVPMELAQKSAPELILGGSAGAPDVARRLVEEGADYLGVGALYDAHPSKSNASDPRGPQAITAVRDAIGDVPMVGIGGITAETAREVVEAGADGVAVIRAVVGASDPERAAQRLREAMRARVVL